MRLRRNTTRYFLHTLIGSSLLFLAACGGSGSEPVVEEPTTFEGQEVNWEACDPNIFPEDSEGFLAILGDRLECATLRAPLDWNDLAQGEINLGVLRVRAGDPSNRQGAILTNPGGPGADGLLPGALYGLTFATGGFADRPTAAPDLLTQVSEQYDVIGFSPRGVGGSSQLFCDSNEIFPETNFYTDRSPENVQALLTAGRLEAEACLSNPLSEVINTEQTVQDMDLIRRLLGDEKLNFLGYSYGSWLGAWYAKRFPKHAGNMVLDANVNFSAPFQDTFELQPLGTQRAFEEVALAYTARNNALFELGATQEEVYGVYEALPSELKDALLFGQLELISQLYGSENMQVIAGSLVAARGVNEVIKSLESPLSPETFETFLQEVATYTYVSSEEGNAGAVALATTLAEDYIGVLTAPPEEVMLSPEDAVYIAVRCNDSPWIQDPNYYIEFGNEQNEAYPFYGGFQTRESSPCGFWGEPSAQMPDVPEDIPPILLVQTGFDPATPVEGAEQAFKSLPNAKLVYIENEVSHIAFPYNTPCVDAKVAAYLLDGTLPEEDISSCPAKPLPGETEVYAPGGVPSFGSQSLSVQAAQTPGANALYDLLHETVRENAADFHGH